MTDYKVGTPADIYYADTKVRGLRVPGGWSLETDWASFLSDDVVTEVRPLVVLDPDDETAWLVPMVVAAENYEENTPAEDQSWEDMARAMVRSLSRPPKPPEPQGLGAVVEDSEGVLWTRCSRIAGHPWQDADDNHFGTAYEAIDVVRVLSEGVQP